MSKQGGGVRIDFTGATREYIHALYSSLRGLEGIGGVSPILTPGGRLSLVLMGDAKPDAVAAAVRKRLGDLVQQVKVQGQVVQVKFKGAPGLRRPGERPRVRPGRHGRPQASKLPKKVRPRGGKP